MTGLAEQRCQPCEGGIAPLSLPKAKLMAKKLDKGWALAADGKSITRALKFRDFYRTMSFVNAVAHIANSEDHHPDLSVGYDYCRITYSTHAIDGLSINDFICAAKIDRL